MTKVEFPQLDEATRVARLAPHQPPHQDRIRMVLDTDTYNEVDDQFALAHALLSPDVLSVEAIYAAPFHNSRSTGPADGMAKSYEEILPRAGPAEDAGCRAVFKGADRFLAADLTPVVTPAVSDLIDRALGSSDQGPLTVVAIGAITNVASALLVEPSIVSHITVIWLGGHALNWPHAREFNLKQDVPATRVVLDSGVPLVLIPAMGVMSHLHTTVPELEAYLAGRSAIGDYLTEIVKGYHADHKGWSKVIWDIATIAYLLDPAWTPSVLVHTPLLTDQVTWSVDRRRHLVRYVYHVDRDPIFRDLFAKLAGA